MKRELESVKFKSIRIIKYSLDIRFELCQLFRSDRFFTTFGEEINTNFYNNGSGATKSCLKARELMSVILSIKSFTKSDEEPSDRAINYGPSCVI